MVLAVGCLIYFCLASEPSFSDGLIVLISGLAGMSVIRWRYPSFQGCYQLSCCLFLLGAGFCLAWLQTHRQEPFYRLPTHAVRIQGKVQQVENLATGKIRLSVNHVHFLDFPESEEKERKRSILFTLPDSNSQNIATGDWIQARVMLRHPFPPVRIHGYDLQFHAWFKNIGAYGYALAPVIIIKKSHKTSIQAIRENIAHRIETVLPDETGAIAQILLTGIGSKLPKEDRHVFAVAGLAHLLAIAGLHLGTVMLIVGGVTRWLLVRNEYIALYWPVKSIALLIGWCAGCLYLLLTGFHLPAVRSLIMASLIVFSLFIGRQAISMHNLMLAALFILIVSPSSVLDVSFQMSMVAVMALIAGYRFGYDLFLRKKHQYYGLSLVFFYVLEAGWVSLLAGLAVCPIVMARFHELNLYFILANLIAVPLTILWVLPMGLLSLLTIGTGIDYYFLHGMSYGIALILFTAKTISHFPHAVILVQDFPSLGLACYFMGLCWLCLCVTRLRLIGFVFIALGILSCLFVKIPDLVTSADGQMIAIRERGFLWFVCQHYCNVTTMDEWKRYLGRSNSKVLTPFTHDPSVFCDDFFCKIPNRHLLIIFKKPKFYDRPLDFCDGVTLEVSFLWNAPVCRNGSEVIDKQKNWVFGSHSLWLNPLKIKTDYSVRKNRPWVLELVQRGAPNLPMALRE